MKKVLLSKGRFAFVDDKDFEAVSKFKWCLLTTAGKKYYAVRTQSLEEAAGDVGRRLYLHRELSGAKEDQRVKLKNGDGLDCRRENLVVVAPTIAALNRRKARRIHPIVYRDEIKDANGNLHPYRGIFRDIGRTEPGGYMVKILNVGPQYYGSFSTLEIAAVKRAAEDAKREEMGLSPIDWVTDTREKERSHSTVDDSLHEEVPGVSLEELGLNIPDSPLEGLI